MRVRTWRASLARRCIAKVSFPSRHRQQRKRRRHPWTPSDEVHTLHAMPLVPCGSCHRHVRASDPSPALAFSGMLIAASCIPLVGCRNDSECDGRWISGVTTRDDLTELAIGSGTGNCGLLTIRYKTGEIRDQWNLSQCSKRYFRPTAKSATKLELTAHGVTT